MKEIIKEIEKIFSEDSFHLNFFKAVKANYYDLNNPIRYNNFAYSMRELLRLFFEERAPADKIINCIWFCNKTKKPDKISRGERLTYLIQGGITDSQLPEEFVKQKNNFFKTLIMKIDELSKYTHITRESYGLSEDESNEKFEYLLKLILSIFKTEKELRENVRTKIHDILCDSIREVLWSSIPDEVDELSTHSSIEDVEDVYFGITNIDNKNIYISGNGEIGCDLQYGSNSDLRRGDGARSSISLPFEFEATLPVDDIEKLQHIEFDFSIDNSKFYGPEEEVDIITNED